MWPDCGKETPLATREYFLCSHISRGTSMVLSRKSSNILAPGPFYGVWGEGEIQSRRRQPILNFQKLSI